MLFLRLPAPILLLAAALYALCCLPRDNYISPRPLNSKSHYEDFYNPELPCVSVFVPSMAYTGCDARNGIRLQGRYYYTLEDGFCQFYLLDEAGGESASPIRESLQLDGRLLKLTEEEYEALLTSLAEELNWTTDSLRRMTAPYVVSTLRYPYYRNLLLRLVAWGSCLYALAGILCCLYYLLWPQKAEEAASQDPALRRKITRKKPGRKSVS